MDIMDRNFLLPILALAIFTTIAYFRGKKKNEWISGWISKDLEAVLKPIDTNYINVGGTIGYNFTYSMKKPFKEAKGIFTFLPRQSALFMPISLLLTKHDKCYLQLFVDGKLAGEGHIISKSHFPRASRQILGIATLNKQEINHEGNNFILLWKEDEMKEKLEKFLTTFSYPELLLHFCCYEENKNFYLYVKPVWQKLRENLNTFFNNLSPFFLKGGNFDKYKDERED